MKNQNNTVSEKDLRNDERISAYMRGNMSKEEEAAFMADIKADEMLRARAVAMGYLVKALNDVGNERDKELMDAMMTTTDGDGKRIALRAMHKAKIVELWHRYIKVAAVAATVLVLCVVGYQYFDYRSTTGLANQYASAFGNERLYVRGTENTIVTKELDVLFANVSKGNDLDTTTCRLALLWELSTMETYNDYTDYMPIIGWNLAIAYLKDNDKDDARTVLIKLLSRTQAGTVKYDKAKELLEKIQ